MTTVASFSSIPFLVLSDFLCRKFGYVQCIAFGLICYSIRCLGYSLIKNYYWCFPFEVIEGITTGLLVASAIIYGSKLSQQSNLGTLQGILATFHYGFGKSAGSLLGGFLMGRLGGRVAFRIFSGGSFIFAFAYYLIFKLVFQPRIERAEKRKRDVSNMQVEIIPKEDLSIAGPESSKGSKGKTELYPITSTPIKNSSSYPSNKIENENERESNLNA
ncbi:Major facilitator superfamily domain-containing protein 6-A [Armadillidium nasatum]|uniref:Major facilitator superfamily domain-containing protein 6-A n=1 Tax=Armadillidium nasatum TaxID=96803 RepID=A0A5N5SPP1_9CRUS|nr:Major facilitator superfamily domain-containing protein 6-A [Armadillidium nasatum]